MQMVAFGFGFKNLSRVIDRPQVRVPHYSWTNFGSKWQETYCCPVCALPRSFITQLAAPSPRTVAPGALARGFWYSQSSWLPVGQAQMAQESPCLALTIFHWRLIFLVIVGDTDRRRSEIPVVILDKFNALQDRFISFHEMKNQSTVRKRYR